MFKNNPFLLGSFCSNCSNGMSITKIPERWVNSWDNNLKLGKMLDEAGIDFMLPVARWIGTPGEEIDFHGSVLETITWATGLLATTKNINIFSTIHTTVNHPVVLAKQLATMSQIGNGRVGLNVVAGWHRPEYEALGFHLPEDHETRYAYAQEWLDVIKKLWQEEDYFDWEGNHFNLKRVKSDPRPTVDVLTFSHVICRPTEEEALEYLEYAAQTNADWTAVDNVINMQFANAHSFPHDLLTIIRDRFALGHGGFPLVGTPEQVADGITALAEAGFKGTTLSFVDYNAEFPYFRDHVLPIIEKRGLRKNCN